jgi:SAM-dependent methyltransferase
MTRTGAMPSRSNTSAPDRIVGLYEENASAWDSVRDAEPRLERDWLDRFSAMLPPGAVLLDLGCGSGQPMARDLVRRGFRVVGLDSSPSLIALCRMRFPEQEWLVADMRKLDLGRSFQGAIVWHSSFHLTHQEQRGLFPRLSRHLAPGAPLLITSGEEAGVRIGAWQGEPLYHASLAPEEYRALLADNGFDLVRHRLCDPEAGGATVWLARRKS